MRVDAPLRLRHSQPYRTAARFAHFCTLSLISVRQPHTIMNLKQTDLYGGTIRGAIPEGYADVSLFRQVPDHQEAFVNQDGEDSLLYDILERVPKQGKEAVNAHLEELADLNGVGQKYTVKDIRPATASKTEGAEAYISIAVEPSNKWGRPDHGEVEHIVAIVVGLVRLEKADSDILITFNVPFKDATEVDTVQKWLHDGPVPQRLGEAIQAIEQCIDNFEVKDWSLFG